MGIQSIISIEITMKERKVSILPLYYFLERLRQNDFPVGVGEYERFLRALNISAGIDIDDYEIILQTLSEHAALGGANNAYPRNYLLRLCKLLWLKPGQSARLFEDIFEETFALDFEKINKPTTEQDDQKNKPVSAKPEINIPEKKANPEAIITDKPATGEKKPGGNLQTETSFDNIVAVRIEMGEDNTTQTIDMDPEEKEFEKSKFLLTQNYVPLNRRKIQQELRKFSSFSKVERTSEVDIDKTIGNVVRQGFFNEVAYKINKKNIATVLVLVDHEGSMVAFDNLSENILSQLGIFLQKGKKKKDTTLKTYYFYNVWGKFLFKNKPHTLYDDTDKILKGIKNRHSGVIIISDAGAARGTYNEKRINATKDMLQKLKGNCNRVAWLNPMPKRRWANTSAERIGENVAMFEASERGIKEMVQLFKGTHKKIIKAV